MLLCAVMVLTMSIPAFAEDSVMPLEEGSSQETGSEQQEESAPDQGEDIPPADTGSAPETQPHVHSWTETQDTATCTDDGKKVYTCSGCTETKAEASPAKGHSFGSGVKLDENSHEQTCTACSEKRQSVHTLDEGKTTKEATCQETGLLTYSCTGCSHTIVKTIPVSTTHSYGNWSTTNTDHSRTCTVCQKVESGKHSLDEGKVDKKPTCKEEGRKIYTCTVCSAQLTETLAKLTTHTYDSACDKDCNVCGNIRETQHSYTIVWSKDYNGHWHECTKCSERKDFAKHIPGPAATEDREQVCLTCSYVITPKKNHTHTYETKWSNDEVGHWYACKTCDSEKDYAAHVFDNDCDPDCNVCSYKKETAHTYKDPWQTNEKEHWNVCTVCNEESEHEKHIPGPEATDEAAQVCTVCAYELAPILEHTHDFGNNWVQAQESHWQECKCGELSIPESHVWDEGKKNRDDTVTFTCTFCGMEKTEEASGGFPWVMLILGLLALICVAGIVVIIIILKRGNFDEYEEEAESADESMGEEEEGLLDRIRNFFENTR